MMKYFLLSTLLCVIFGTSNAQNLKLIKYTDNGDELNGWITSNAGGNHPGVLILPAWKGVDDEARHAAENLEKEGYIAFIADIYGVKDKPADNAAAGKMASQYIKDPTAYQHRISLALEQLKKQIPAGNKIVVIGYCFGGTGALETARAGLPVDAVVSIHGGLSKAPDRPNGPIRSSVLVLNPAEDHAVTPEVYAHLVKEFNDGNADWQIITYADSKHTFTDPNSPDYNPVMAKRAWNHLLMFLHERLD